MNLDHKKVEKLIREDVKAIMPVHVYGNACNIEGFDDITRRYGLPIVSDATHAFGIKYKSKTLVSYGEYSVMSFHATKVFNTIEGGAVISKSVEGKRKIDL